MTTTFSSGSRLANLREKKNSNIEDPLNIQGELKLTMPETEQKTTYEPSSTFHNTRTSMRLLKGRIQRNQSNQKQEFRSTQNGLTSQPKLVQQKPNVQERSAGLKLTLHDSPQITEKKVVQEPPKPPQKRILIQKQPSVDEQKASQLKPAVQQKKVEKKAQEVPIQPKQQYINPHDEKPVIQEQDVEESKDQPENDNDLVMCPEGCGRKFNRRALEKHAKACKIVFMSKRKQFNSEAKRITSKQQATIVKQTKQKQKTNLGKTKGKGFDKTSDNWKAASEDFRAAIKAVKKQQDEEENHNQEQEVDTNLQLVDCQYCEKKFAQVLLQKHIQNCPKKKQKQQRKKTTKKK